MKYFIVNTERRGSYYHEFFKGKWDGKTFWKNDSIYLNDNILSQLEIGSIILSVIPEYDPYGVTKVSEREWKAILNEAERIGGDAYTAILEANEWVIDNFNTHTVFTILGI